jgi:hypothetical protein
LARISSQELNEWEALYLLEPFGFDLQNHRHGSLMALLANTNRDPEVKPNPYESSDFMYEYRQGNDSETPERNDKQDERVIKDNWSVMKQKAKMWVTASKVL